MILLRAISKKLCCSENTIHNGVHSRFYEPKKILISLEIG